jgi:minor extracellular serine protease Vpr
MLRSLLLLVFTGLSLMAQQVPGQYILELDEEPLADNWAVKSKDTRSAVAYRTREALVRSQQDTVRTALSSRKVRIKGTAEVVANAIVVEGADLAALQNLPGVKAIVPVTKFKPLLDHVVPLMKFPEAWAKVGGRDSAGAGMKVGILDTGIDNFHLGFLDDSLPVPDGFPKFSPPLNQKYTNKKVIVARSYDGGLAADVEGHGTAVAMMAAGAYHLGARGNMSGSAPKAYLGNYNVYGSDGITTSSVLLALDDAVRDGMDAINLSFGSANGALRPEEEETYAAVLRRVAAAGVIVVTAAGNNGPDPATVSNPGTNGESIAVGSTENDRIPTNPSVVILPSTRLTAIPASNSDDATAIRGQMVDVSTLDLDGLGCAAFAADSLKGKIALVQRGTCLFSEKFANAKAAGAVGVVVFNNVAGAAAGMDVGEETLPGLGVSRNDGFTIRDEIALKPDTDFLLLFWSVPEDPNQISIFSAAGPTPGLNIKPDLLAVGGSVLTAANETDENDPESSGYFILDGTSLAAPLVTGAAAVLKQARPGLTPAQYRSLLVNSARSFPDGVKAISVMDSGAGMLDLQAAINASTAVAPISVSFGEFRGQTATRNFTVTNVGASGDNLTLKITTNDELKPDLSTTVVSLGPGESQRVTLDWTNTAAASGAYQGFIEITSSTGTVARVPYWLAVRDTRVAGISLLSLESDEAPGTLIRDFYFRVVDKSGLSLTEPIPQMTVVSGSGTVLSVDLLGGNFPGVYVASMRLGRVAGLNVFKITAGGVEREVRIQGAN